MIKYLDKSEIEGLKSRVDSLSFYAAELNCEFKSTGNNWYKADCLCPFHEDKKPGTLHVNSISGAYHCFACDAKGDVIDFIMKRERITFSEAIKKIKEIVR